ncbi:AraC family transcriptional regulator [Spongiibacter sp. KMU-158]|uniref:AraC family transcriptional regulator n=1 Tax=Spongiibacter pelagi TaxID=2760804 RepID=A0A927C4C4_9GAMM|nr:AraC family transcriptional regulator [Spongiibacter pelagi]MBD2859521.1 AraC family transcriptional regulator [Spongiibacter pelagi]
MRNKPQKHWTTIGYYKPVFDYLRTVGQSNEPALKLLGLRESDLSNPDLRIDNGQFGQLFELAEQQCNDPHIGLHAGLTMQVQHVGIVGLLAMSCQYAREVFELHARYQSLVGNGFVTRYHIDDQTICMEAELAEGHRPLSRHEYEYNLAGWYRLKSLLIGGQNVFERIELPYERSDPPSLIETLITAPVSYGHKAIRAYIPRSEYDAKLLGTDPQIKQILEVQAQKRLLELRGEQADTDEELAQVRRLIAEKLAYGLASLEAIAASLDISVRTLQRRLDQRNTSFTQVVDEVRRELAHKYIHNNELSLLEIAMMLGFAEQSSFNRAFKRWFGNSPGAYRQGGD